MPSFLSAGTELWPGCERGGPGQAGKGSGTVRQTPGTLDTLRHNPDTLPFAQVPGV